MVRRQSCCLGVGVVTAALLVVGLELEARLGVAGVGWLAGFAAEVYAAWLPGLVGGLGERSDMAGLELAPLWPVGWQVGVVGLVAWGASWVGMAVGAWRSRLLLALAGGLVLVVGTAVIYVGTLAWAVRGPEEGWWVLVRPVVLEPSSLLVAAWVGSACGWLIGASGCLRIEARRVRQLAGRVRALAVPALAARVGGAFPLGEGREVVVLEWRLSGLDELVGEGGREVMAEVWERFQARVEARIKLRGGYLELVRPGQVRACFWAPLAGRRPALRALRAALELRDELEGAQLAVLDELGWGIDYGIGVAAGEVFLDERGAGEHARLEVVGGVLGLAALLAVENRKYGSRVLVDGRAVQQAGEAVRVRPFDLIEREGGGVIEPYELVGEVRHLTAEDEVRREAFWEGVLHLRAGAKERAAEAFGRAGEGLGDERDRPLEFYRRAVAGLVR
jgi:hypothetical protein